MSCRGRSVLRPWRKGNAMEFRVSLCARICLAILIILSAALPPRTGLAAEAGAPVGGTQPSVAAEKVRVAFSAVSPSQGVLWVAEVAGLLPKNGIGAEIIYTRAAIETLVAGEVDLGQMTGSLMSSARLQGADPVMIAGVQDILEDRLMARPNIKSMEDLRGKRIGVFRFGAASHLRLIYILPRYGLSARDVTLLQVGDTPDRLVALSSGAVDATLISPPDHLEAQRLGMKVLLNLRDLNIA